MLSRHAEVRCNQRGIDSEVLDALMTFGQVRHRHGAEIYYMDHEARRRAERELNERVLRRIRDRLNAYLVVSPEGTVITAAKRRRRLKF